MFKRPFLFLLLSAILMISPAPLRMWRWDGSALQPVPPDFTITSSPGLALAFLDGDSVPEQLTLAAGRAVISSEGVIRWQSPASWQVQQAGYADLNHDGALEAVLLVRRPFAPWPVDRWMPNGGRIDSFQDKEGYSSHIILIGWRFDTFRERWAGSALAQPVKAFAAADLDGDGRQELITLDSDYDAAKNAPATRLTVWEWNGFGFSVISSRNGLFSGLRVVRNGDEESILITP